MLETIHVDYAKIHGVPLFKKFALFNSGITPLKNYKRNIDSLTDIHVDSLRLDIFIGNDEMPFGNTVTGKKNHMIYDFTTLDELTTFLKDHDIRPYLSWCYIPKPLQIEDDWRSGPSDLEEWQKMFTKFARHYKELGIPVYHEVFNEPDCDDVFFLGSWDEYMEMYKYGVKGLKLGDEDAIVGGPATAFIEKQPGIDCFLKMVQQDDLPLDFFSYHSYGYQNKEYLSRVEIARHALSKYPRFDTTEMHLNELNTIPFPWPEGGLLDRTKTAVTMLTSFNELLDETDLTLVHWAQWLSSTVDGLGMIDKQSYLKASMHAYRMYNEMPLRRVKVSSTSNLGSFASLDDDMACLLLWNDGDHPQNTKVVLDNIPFEKGKVYIYALDDETYNYPFNSCEDLSPIETEEIDSYGDYSLEVNIPESGIVYIKIMNITTRELERTPHAKIKRKLHYYPERGKSNYAEFDGNTWSAWLGMGDEGSALSVIGLSLENTPDTFIADFELSGSFEYNAYNTYLGIRVDYKVDDEYVIAVEHQVFSSERRTTVVPWGTKTRVDEIIRMNDALTSSVVIDIARHAPEKWNRESIITFEMHNTGKHTQAVMRLK